jgi:hypothetical protein
VQRSLVLNGIKGKRLAKAEAVKKLRDINSGTRRPQSATSFEDFWNNYFDSEVIERRKISTRQMYRYLGKKHLLPYFGKRPLCDLSRGEVQDFINLKERENYSPQTVRHFRNMLSKFFGAAMSREIEQLMSLTEEKIYQLAGEKFNISSPKQLQVVLFEKLGLPKGRKTKEGHSTDIEVLTNLARSHELPIVLVASRRLPA